MQDEAMSFRLSPQQELVWTTEPDGPTGAVQAVLELDGPLDVPRLRAALAKVVDRHEILRTTFQRRPGMKTPLQVVREQLAPEWSEGGGAEDERTRPWDYANGPLLRARLIVLGDGLHALVLTAAPSCADAGSLATIASELAAHYAGDAVVDEPLQYADFAEWQHQLASDDDEGSAAGREYWSEVDARAPTPLPFEREAAAASPETHDVDVPLSAETIAAIATAAERYRVSAGAIVQAALHLTVAKLAGEEEVTVGYVPAGRVHAELETAVGPFARALRLRSRPAGTATVAELAVAIQRVAELAERWQDTAPLEPARSGVGFVALELPGRTTAGETTFRWRSLSAPPAFPVELDWDGTACRLRVDPAALDPALAERTARYLGRALATGAAAPDTAVSDVELLDEADVRRLTVEANATETELPAATIAGLIASAAAAAPDRVAVVDDDRSVTYAELERRANGLAHRLRRSGVGAGSIVGLCTDRSTEMIVGLVGILKAGAAYLPLNFEHPPARLGHQLDEAGAAAIVTQEPLSHRLPAFDGDVVCLDRDRAALDSEPGTAPADSSSPDDLVYVIYTSGSTGTAKGVGVTNANLCNYVRAIGRRLGADTEPLSFGMVSAISTDLGNTAVFPALCHGGTLVLVSPAAAADGSAAAAFLRANPIDVLKITPSHLNALLVGSDAAGVLPRRWLVVGGEALSWDLVARVRELADCRILNHYGPTETTVGSCTFALDEAGDALETATVPIGFPLANTSCYVLDERRRCVPEGVLGELYIGGAGVAAGYVGRPDLTDERFHADPFGPGRMYATGDVVRRLPDGALEFRGRRDDQVKIRGFRVEPAEIESALRAHESVREAVVVAHEDARGDRKLAAYVVLGSPAASDDLRTHLGTVIPDYMIPSAVVVLDALPLTPSGKVDRVSLPDPEAAEARSAATYVAPRTPVEESVAAIWADVLGVESVGVEDDFFALGGHSLLATQIVAQVRSDFSINLPLHALFTSPTVASLSQQVVQLLGQASDDDTEKLLSELAGLSDEDVALLLAADTPPETPAP